MWKRLVSTPADQLKQNSWGNVAYAQLMHQPEVYRGRIVSVQGTARRARKVTVASGDHDLSDYWELWVDPTWGPAAPIVVCCPELPSNFPTGDTIRCPIECEGYFYKRWAYKAQDGVRTAPVLLAKILVATIPQPALPPPAATPAISGPWLAMACLTGLLGVGSACWAFGNRRSNHQPNESVPSDLIAPQPASTVTERFP